MSPRTAGSQAAAASSVKSADRLMTLLEYLADVRQATFQSIVRDLEWPNSSTHQLLQNVTQRGFVDYDESGRTYRLGLRVWQLGQAYNQSSDLPTLAQPLMDELVEVVGETVQLARLDGTDDVHLAVAETKHPVKLFSAVGMRLPAHVTGIGKALLSGLTDEQIRERLAGTTLHRFTPKTITDIDELVASIQRIRETGHAEDNEEYAVGCRCFARPVHDPDGAVVAAMSVSVPTPRYTPALGKKIVTALADTVQQLESKLGRALRH